MKNRKNNPDSEILNKRGASSLLGIGTRTLETYMAKGFVSYIKIGKTVMFKRSKLMADLDLLTTTKTKS